MVNSLTKDEKEFVRLARKLGFTPDSDSAMGFTSKEYIRAERLFHEELGDFIVPKKATSFHLVLAIYEAGIELGVKKQREATRNQVYSVLQTLGLKPE